MGLSAEEREALIIVGHVEINPSGDLPRSSLRARRGYRGRDERVPAGRSYESSRLPVGVVQTATLPMPR
jgi:hypothetical protein